MSVLRGYLPTGRTAEWESGCPSPMAWVGRADGACSVAPLAVGETRMVVLRSDVPEGGPIRLTLEAEGNELAPADNEITIAAAGPEAAPAPAPAPTPVKTARKQRLRNGIKLKLTGEGATRTTATIKVNTRQVRLTRTVKLTRKRTVTLRATGAKLRSLRRALTRSSSLRVRVVARGRRARRRSRRPA